MKKIYSIHGEGVITSPNTSIQSTIVYALGVAIEKETDPRVKEDLRAVEVLMMECEDSLIISEV